jgi:hypothetical protein
MGFMDQEELYELERLSIYIDTDLRILKNAVTNCDENDLEFHDLTEFLGKIYEKSNKMRKIFTTS